jgi:hypothetical protein
MSTSADGSSASPSRPFNPRATVNIVTWFLLVVSAVAVLVRLTIKRVTAKRLYLDDALAALSVVSDFRKHSTKFLTAKQITHVGSGAATTVASNNGVNNGVASPSVQETIRFSQVSSYSN